MSEPVSSIYALIPRVMKDIGAIGKNHKNEQQKYSFRGIEDFYEAAHPAMVEHGIFCAPTVLEREAYRFEKTNDFGKVTTWMHVALRVEHRFYGPDGSYVPVTTWGEGLDNSDKASNKAMSGAMKYALIELFCVPTRDVEDSDRTSPETGVRRPDVARTSEDIPIAPKSKSNGKPEPGAIILPPEEDLITSEQAAKLHMRFRDSLSDDLKSKADALLHDWLGQKLYLDAGGNPSARAIRKDEFAITGKAAVAFAKEISS